MSSGGPGRVARSGSLFAIPIAIGLATAIGLIAALTGDGLRDVLSWITLSVPVAALICALRYRRR